MDVDIRCVVTLRNIFVMLHDVDYTIGFVYGYIDRCIHKGKPLSTYHSSSRFTSRKLTFFAINYNTINNPHLAVVRSKITLFESI